ncbi:MAG: hypothetical protein H0X51_07390 [Parachlamydiaceae bacterium]|nr:hypothetical protein [Parachlamydiaceae bacterium]
MNGLQRLDSGFDLGAGLGLGHDHVVIDVREPEVEQKVAAASEPEQKGDADMKAGAEALVQAAAQLYQENAVNEFGLMNLVSDRKWVLAPQDLKDKYKDIINKHIINYNKQFLVRVGNAVTGTSPCCSRTKDNKQKSQKAGGWCGPRAAFIGIGLVADFTSAAFQVFVTPWAPVTTLFRFAESRLTLDQSNDTGDKHIQRELNFYGFQQALTKKFSLLGLELLQDFVDSTPEGVKRNDSAAFKTAEKIVHIKQLLTQRLKETFALTRQGSKAIVQDLVDATDIVIKEAESKRQGSLPVKDSMLMAWHYNAMRQQQVRNYRNEELDGRVTRLEDEMALTAKSADVRESLDDLGIFVSIALKGMAKSEDLEKLKTAVIKMHRKQQGEIKELQASKGALQTDLGTMGTSMQHVMKQVELQNRHIVALTRQSKKDSERLTRLETTPGAMPLARSPALDRSPVGAAAGAAGSASGSTISSGVSQSAHMQYWQAKTNETLREVDSGIRSRTPMRSTGAGASATRGSSPAREIDLACMDNVLQSSHRRLSSPGAGQRQITPFTLQASPSAGDKTIVWKS